MSIINFIHKKKKELRTLFGEKELQIIERQIIGAPLMKSERTRLSRDIRPKLRIIQELAKFEDEFDLKKGAETKKEIEKSVEAIKFSKYFPFIEKIILFGSIRDNRLRLDSDIDIAVVLKKEKIKEAHNCRINLLGRVDADKVDIQIYNSLPLKLKKEIDEKGKILFKR